MDHVLFPTVTRLAQLLSDEANSLMGIEDQVKRLQGGLLRLQGILKHVSFEYKSYIDDIHQEEIERVRECVVEMIDVGYDAEDLIETYVVKSASETDRMAGAMDALKGLIGINNDRVESKIEAMIGRLQELESELPRLITEAETMGYVSRQSKEYSTALNESQREQMPQSSCYPSVDENILVGIDEKVEELVSSLVDESETKRPIVAIHGHRGSGKTTLAKKVYNHSRIRSHFNHFAWVHIDHTSVIQSFWLHTLLEKEKEKVYRDILFTLLSSTEQQRINEILELTIGELYSKIHEFVQEEKCLLVLDGILDCDYDDALLELVIPFFHETTCSKILIASEVKYRTGIEADDPRLIVHQPHYLNIEESWELVQKIIRSTRNCPDFDTRMEEVGKRIIDFYGDISILGIIVLGGILAIKHSLNEWERMEANLKSTRDTLEDLIISSYDILPISLKLCVLHLSLIPRECKMNVDRLIQIWIAEGFISHVEGDQGGTLEDVARNYLNELILRRIVFVGERNVGSKVKTCYLHGLLKDVYSVIAKKECFRSRSYTYMGISYWQEAITHDRDMWGSYWEESTTRRHFVQLFGYRLDVSLEFKKEPKLRSLVCFHGVNYERWRLDKHALDHYKLLRVLDLEKVDCGGENLLKNIGELIHLRYLSMRNAKISKIPSSIGNLRFLQTLDLLIDGTVYIPNVIWKLKQLRYLCLPEVLDVKTKLKLDSLTNLRTLVNFPTCNSDFKDLFTLTNLRELTIRDSILIRNFEKFSKLLNMRLKYLRSISFDNSYKEDDGGASEFEDLSSTSFGDLTISNM